MILNLRDFRTKARTRANPGGLPSLDYAVAVTRDSLREFLSVRTAAEVQRLLERADILGVLAVTGDRRSRWVRLPDGSRKRMFVFAGNRESVRRSLRADAYDNPPESSGTRVRVLTWQ